jgi:hypothetical protein
MYPRCEVVFCYTILTSQFSFVWYMLYIF